MNKILIPTDFSKGAEAALQVAAQLAKQHNSELHVLHMMEFPLDLIDALHENSELPEAIFFMKMAHKKFQAFLDKPYLEGINVIEGIQNNMAFEGIVDTAHKKGVDLIVMGSRGASGFKEMVIGSNTEKVVRTSDIPVLVIKTATESFVSKNIVFASEFTEEYKPAFAKAINFAKQVNATLHLVMINTPSEFLTTAATEDRMQNFVKDISFKNYTLQVYNDVNVEKGILNFSRAIDADIIAMSTHGRKGLSHFFNGSISEDLVNHAKRPVITFKI